MAIQLSLSLSSMWFFLHPLTPLRLYKKACWTPISVFLVLYKPATSPCGWKPEWKKRGYSKNNHTYTNTLTYGTVTFLSSYDPRHGGTADWHALFCGFGTVRVTSQWRFMTLRLKFWRFFLEIMLQWGILWGNCWNTNTEQRRSSSQDI